MDNILKTRNKIIDKIKSRYRKQEFKFGILLPKKVNNAFRIDQLNDDHFWGTSVENELKTVCFAQKLYKQNGPDRSLEQIRADKKKHLVGYKEIICHLLSYIKMDGSFMRKTFFCTNGSKTNVPKSLSYSSVVSRASVCIAFLLESLNKAEVLAYDIFGTYLNATVGEKVWFVDSFEMRARKGMVMIIMRVLYGLKPA